MKKKTLKPEKKEKKYKVIYADPPWEMGKMGLGKDTRPGRKYKVGKTIKLNYPTMSVEDICKLPIQDIIDEDCHLWLWTTNKHLKSGFEVMEAWGFKYLAPITWVKPNGMGAWFVHRTQTILFGYKGKCAFGKGRYKPTVFFAPTPREHSRKPAELYDWIESISSTPRLELFARPISPMFPKRLGWDVWGNEVKSDIDLGASR